MSFNFLIWKSVRDETDCAKYGDHISIVWDLEYLDGYLEYSVGDTGVRCICDRADILRICDTIAEVQEYLGI